MKLALVYDRVSKIGGAERILVALHEIWPQAPLYTSVYNPKTAPWAKVFPKVIPSFLQNFPFATHHELYASLMPLAFESFSAKGGPASGGSFDDYDVVISVTTEAAKGIITKPKTLHICYCLTPTRYLWSHYDLYFRGEFFRWLTKPVVTYLRVWDKIASQRPDYFIALSENVKKRIKKYYDRDSGVIYPPVGLPAAGPAARYPHPTSSVAVLPAGARWGALQGESSGRAPAPATPRSTSLGTPTPYTLYPKPFFLVVSRLVPYKRIDIAVEAFNELGWPLKIVGVGSEMGKLKAMAKSNIEFLGELTEEALLRYYQGCQALIFPQEEDLGLTAIEAQACGRPVIAFQGGGALETIIEGKTGEFFYPQTKEALIERLKDFKDKDYSPKECRKNAERFDKKVFKKKFKARVEDLWRQHLKTVT